MLWHKIQGAGGVGGAAGSFSFLSNTYQTTGGSPFTFSSQSLGDTDGDRWILVLGYYSGGDFRDEISSITLGGTSMTLATRIDNESLGTAIFYLKETTSSSADIVVTAGSSTECGISIYRLISTATDPFSSGDSRENTSTASVSASGLAVIAGSTSQNGSTSPTVSSDLSEDFTPYDWDTNDYVFGYSTDSGNSTSSIAGASNNYNQSIAAFTYS